METTHEPSFIEVTCVEIARSWYVVDTKQINAYVIQKIWILIDTNE